MHRDHDNFVRAMQDKKKVKLTFYSEEQRGQPSSLCGPIIFSPQVAGEGSECYYFWDFESDTDGSLLVLSPSQIASMELTSEPFDLQAFFTAKPENGRLTMKEPKIRPMENRKMGKICKNCGYFVPSSFLPSGCEWGDCTKGTEFTNPDTRNRPDRFRWADQTCDGFSPKKEAE